MDDFKTYASRTLNAEGTQYQNVIWQAGKPPLDSELNLVGQIAKQNLQDLVKAQAHSGVLIDPRSSDRDYIFRDLWSNYFKVKSFSAVVNGQVVNVEELEIKLPPPPPSGSRVDFVFLEVWNSIISAENSGLVDNKPSPTEIYQNGNVAGSVSLSDELVDGLVGFETTKRVQTQYQIRVVSSVDLKASPEGMSSPLVTAVGPTDGSANVAFSHVEGDAGLWVAEVNDDYLSENKIYGIPLCSVFRRNEEPYRDVSNAGGPNQNGSVNRKPSSSSSQDASPLVLASLDSSLSRDFLGAFTLSNLEGSELSDLDLFSGVTSRFFVIGSGLSKEIIKASSIDLNTNTITIEQRGVAGTQAKYHSSGVRIRLHNSRPDGKFADEVHPEDILDMRHATTLGEWDYQSLLESSVADLLFGELKSTFKQNSINSYCQGTTIEEVSYLSSVASNRTHQMDYPNGFRDTWSDASVPQMGLTLYLNPVVSRDANGLSTVNLNVSSQNEWEIGPDLSPSAFLFDGATPLQTSSLLFLTLDGSLDNLGYGIKGNSIQDKGIRFISPRENGSVNLKKRPPFIIEQLGSEHENISYPTFVSNFEKPFIVLGRNRGTESFVTSVSDPDKNNHNYTVLYKKSAFNESVMSDVQGAVSDEYDQVLAVKLNSNPLNAEDMALVSPFNSNLYLGDESNLYAVVYGDPTQGSKNNGVYKVISLNSYFMSSDYYIDKNLTPWNPSAGIADTFILEPIDNIGDRDGLLDDGISLTIEFRSQEMTEFDDDICIAVTEGSGTILNTNNEFQLSVSVLYPPALGATANVPKNIHKIGITAPNREHLLNNAPSDLDVANTSEIPLVSGEINLPVKNHISLWNRLPSSSLPVGWADASKLGGNIINEEADRESEVFKDEGSKTLVLRPYQKKQVLVHQHESVQSLIPANYSNGDLVDGASLFLSTGAYVIPEALVPRFGRQDIPLHTRTSSSDSFLNGLNHIFVDKTSSSDPVFNIVGGISNQGTPGVEPLLFDTQGVYGKYDQTLSNVNAIGVRKREEGGQVNSRTNPIYAPTSDFGTNLQGIELPPYYGVVRVYGIYERSAYLQHIVGAGNTSGHNADRITQIDAVLNGDCPNLLRTDTSSFTLYINQNGGNLDINNSLYEDAHTYILTEHSIDITRIPTYNETLAFKDFDYVVEAVVFGFSDGFISNNRNVLVRRFNGAGTVRNAADVSRIPVDSVIPFAPPLGSKISVAYKRSVYQGDPFFTKGINLLDNTDQTLPYGRKSVSDLQLGSRDQTNVDLLNRRNLQVLASMDFYTTLGTGKIGGAVFPSTVTDVGHTEHKVFRNPSLYNGVYPKTLTSTYTLEPNKGGYASIFLFESASAQYVQDPVAFIITNSEESGGFAHTLSGANAEEMVSNLIAFLQSKSYEAFQVSGLYDGGNSKFFGVITREPYDNLESSILLNKAYAGRNIQIFEGLRETPMSFNFYDSVNGVTLEGSLGLPSRGKTHVNFSRTDFNPRNAGQGNTPISLVGLSSRLPLGSLVRDSDLLCEDILNNQSSYLLSSTGNISTLSNSVPVNNEGRPYTRAVGVSGEVLQLTDGDLSQSVPLAESNTYYSISRGSGSIFGASGNVPGSPFSFLSVSLNESSKPVLKGSVLACRAMLVKNFEESFNGNVRSYGDELQLLVVTHCIDGATRSPLSANTNSSQLTIGGQISPTGYGEGFASADRYRIKGKPLVKINSTETELEVTPAPFNSSES